MSHCDKLNQPRLKYRVEYTQSGMIYEGNSLGDITRFLYAGAESVSIPVREWAEGVEYNCRVIYEKPIQIDFSSDETIFESIGIGFVRVGFFKVISPAMPSQVQ